MDSNCRRSMRRIGADRHFTWGRGGGTWSSGKEKPGRRKRVRYGVRSEGEKGRRKSPQRWGRAVATSGRVGSRMVTARGRTDESVLSQLVTNRRCGFFPWKTQKGRDSMHFFSYKKRKGSSALFVVARSRGGCNVF